MYAKKLLCYFILFISFGIFLHLIVQFYRSSFGGDGKNSVYFDNVHQYFSNKEKFTGLVNAFGVSCHDNISVVVLVLCKTMETSLRNTIRQSWGQWMSSQYSIDESQDSVPMVHHYHSIKLNFVLGSASAETLEIRKELKYLKNETHRYRDLMYFPGLKDSYMNLTLKTLTALNDVMHRCPRVTFFLKADTDIFLNIPLLFEFCQRYFIQAQWKPIIFGNKQHNAPVIRQQSSKWFVPKSKYSPEFFPDYVTGSGYILTRSAVNNVVSTASKVTELFDWEDVAVTGLYSENVSIVDTKLFRFESLGNNLDHCYMKRIILAHRVSPSKMTTIWNEIVANRTVCP